MVSVKPKSIYFLVDTSYQMHENSDNDPRDPLTKVCTFLTHFCQRIDQQPLYKDRVKIHFANYEIPFSPGCSYKETFEAFISNADGTFKAAKKSRRIKEEWRKFILSDEETSEDDKSTFLILTGCLSPTTINSEAAHYFANKPNVSVFDFMGETIRSFNSDLLPSSDVASLKKFADETHVFFLREYVTTVNFGLCFYGQVWSGSRKNRILPVEKIQVVASCGVQGVNGIMARHRSFLMPLPNSYTFDTSDNPKASRNMLAYATLRQLLNAYLNWQDAPKVDETAEPLVPPAPVPVKVEAPVVKAEPKPEPKPVTPTKTSTKTPKKTKQVKAESDEEYTPEKGSGRKSRGSPRGGRRGARSTRGQAKTPVKDTPRKKPGRPKKVLAPETDPSVDTPMKEAKQEDAEKSADSEAAPVPPATEEGAAPTGEAKPDAATAPDAAAAAEVKKASEDPHVLIARVIERGTGIARPAILRLRTLFQHDKHFPDKELIEEEQAAAEEPSAEGTPHDQIPSTRPEDPPVFEPNVTLDELEKLKAGSQDVDYRNLPLKRPSTAADKAAEPKKPKLEDPTDFGQPASPTMDDIVPLEPSLEELCTDQLEPIKEIPVSADWEQERKLIEEQEELKKKVIDANTKYIEIVVLDLTWENFRETTTLVEDLETAEALAEEDKTVVGQEQSHDYNKLTGWYSPVSMLFYINKMIRALRKPNERMSLFEQELRHMIEMVTNGQNIDLAYQFAQFFRTESYEIYGYVLQHAEETAAYFESLAESFIYWPTHHYVPVNYRDPRVQHEVHRNRRWYPNN